MIYSAVNRSLLDALAANDTLVLKWFAENAYALDAVTIDSNELWDEAVRSSAMEPLHYLCAFRIRGAAVTLPSTITEIMFGPLAEETSNAERQSARVEQVLWFQTQGVAMDADLMSLALSSNNVFLVKMLWMAKCPFPSAIDMYTAALSCIVQAQHLPTDRLLPMLDFMRTTLHVAPTSPALYTHPVMMAALEIVRWLHEQGCPLPSMRMIAITRSHYVQSERHQPVFRFMACNAQ